MLMCCRFGLCNVTISTSKRYGPLLYVGGEILRFACEDRTLTNRFVDLDDPNLQTY